jgi:hypothetical protein
MRESNKTLRFWRENSISEVLGVPIRRVIQRQLFVKESLLVTANKISNHATNICIAQVKSSTDCGLGHYTFVCKPSKILLKRSYMQLKMKRLLQLYGSLTASLAGALFQS